MTWGGVSKLSVKTFLKVNYSFKALLAIIKKQLPNGEFLIPELNDKMLVMFLM